MKNAFENRDFWRDHLPDLMIVGIVRVRGVGMLCPCCVLRAFHGLSMGYSQAAGGPSGTTELAEGTPSTWTLV